MSNNVVNVSFGEICEAEEADIRGKNILDFMGTINDWCEEQAIDITTKQYKHQAAVIMTQLQIILMGDE